MTSMSICIPWRDNADRARAKDFVVKHYEQLAPVHLGDSGDGPFNVSTARNNAVAQTDGDVVVLLDADAYVTLEQVEKAVQMAWDSRVLVKPFDMAGYLTRDASEHLYEKGEVIEDFIHPPVYGFVGLSFIIRRDMYDQLHGFDPAFIGYGGDDNAFVAACDNLLGETQFVPGYGYSLYHEASRVTPPDNQERVIRYYQAQTWHDYYALRTDV